MKRDIIVSSLGQATEMIKSFLNANVLPVPENLSVSFGWFVRDLENDDEVGCPCFVCDCGSFVLGQIKTENILIYVKIFANKDLNITRIYQLTKAKKMFFDEIKDGDIFKMSDRFNRFEDQIFIYKNGKIVEY